MRLVVDASIWIDLQVGGVLREAFQLPIEYVSPDVILAELWDVDTQALRALGVAERPLDPADYSLLRRLITRYPAPSVRDLTVLVVALQEGIAILAGDRQLRSAARAEGVRTHGVLWLLEALVRRGVLRAPAAADALEAMLAAKARLPAADCERLLNRWRRQC